MDIYRCVVRDHEVRHPVDFAAIARSFERYSGVNCYRAAPIGHPEIKHRLDTRQRRLQPDDGDVVTLIRHILRVNGELEWRVDDGQILGEFGARATICPIEIQQRGVQARGNGPTAQELVIDIQRLNRIEEEPIDEAALRVIRIIQNLDVGQVDWLADPGEHIVVERNFAVAVGPVTAIDVGILGSVRTEGRQVIEAIALTTMNGDRTYQGCQQPVRERRAAATSGLPPVLPQVTDFRTGQDNKA